MYPGSRDIRFATHALRSAVCAGLLLGAMLVTQPAHAWTIDEPWRTVETKYYRIHYPVDTEAWALDLAARADEMRDRVAEIVGWTPDVRTEMVVLDPFSDANGFALPFVRRPRIGVFPTAPGASTGIGNYRLWSEDLVVHEDAHVVHLIRPSRNIVEKILYDNVLGVSAMAVKSPAWIAEGYATLVEGVLTGQGRPNSDGRATFLRTLAREGQLPTYLELDMSERWRSRSMRYLVGSAYLEWLAETYGDARLPELWARMTGVEMASFDEAFEATFGQLPATLYGRFVAEMTAGAIALDVDDNRSALFLDLSGEVGRPAVSPDGTRVALVTRAEDGPPELVVYTIAEDTEAQEKRAESLKTMLENDPEVVAPMAPRAEPHAEDARRHDLLRVPHDPRWVDDHTILFAAWVSDSHGTQQPDLFLYDLENKRTKRVSRNANLREAEPCGDRAVAVHRQHGYSALVAVHLENGETQALTEPSVTRVEASPRTDVACSKVAWMRHEGEWGIAIGSWNENGLADVQNVALPTAGQLLSFDLSNDGTIVTAALGLGGFIDLWDLSLVNDEGWIRRTHRSGGAFDPEVAPDGTVFFLSTDARGFDLRTLSADAAPVTEGASVDPTWTRGVVRPPPVTNAPDLPTGTAPKPTPYGFGPQSVRTLSGATTTRGIPDTKNLQLGLLVSDLAGRSELIALVGIENNPDVDGYFDQLGARAAWTWRRFALHSTIDAWWLPIDAAGRALDTPAFGGAWTGRYHRRWFGGGLEALAGATVETTEQAVLPGAAGRFGVGQMIPAGTVFVSGRLLTSGRFQDSSVLNVLSSLSVGQAEWQLGAEGEWVTGQDFTAGTIRSGLQPEIRSMGTPWWPTLPADVGSLDNAIRARGQARFAQEAIGVYGELLDVTTCAACTPVDAPLWFLGADLRTGTGAIPIAGVPALSLSGGLACSISETDGSIDVKRCKEGAAWSSWLTIRVEPGRTPEYPVSW